MRHLPSALAIASCLLLAGACKSTEPNPFSDQTQTAPPPASAALIFASSAWSTDPAAPRELFAADADGAHVTRLTFCNGQGSACDNVEASSAPDRNRVFVRRVVDANADGRIADDTPNITFVDLARGVEATVVPASQDVTGVEWSPLGGTVVYSAHGSSDRDDLFQIDANGQNNAQVTSTPDVFERRPRLEKQETFATFERIPPGGRGQIAVLAGFGLANVTAAAPATGSALQGTPYTVGSDADPAVSPDSRSIVFRRLTAIGNGDLGNWDIMTVRTDGTALATVATGAQFRGAPDWGPQGIVFEEVDLAAGKRALVVVQPDGSGRSPIVSLPITATRAPANPRWLAR